MLNHFRTLLWHISRNPLISRSRAHALTRYLRHQLLSRVSIKVGISGWIMPFVEDSQVLVRPGGYLNGISTFGLPELPEMAFVLHALQPTDTFIDVGANVGAFTVIASGVVGARTIAIEPVPSTVRELQTNISLNNIQGFVTVVPVAIGDEVTNVNMEVGRGATNRIATAINANAVEQLPLTTLDEVIGQVNSSLVVKIDVEGYETPALRGARALLQSKTIKAIIVELMGQGSRYGYNEEDLHKWLLSLGYVPCEYDPLNRHLLADASHQPLKKRYVTDSTIYVCDLPEMQKRVREAPKYFIHGLKTSL